jgi:hypothetical protein
MPCAAGIPERRHVVSIIQAGIACDFFAEFAV